jgi:hypothetical protein
MRRWLRLVLLFWCAACTPRKNAGADAGDAMPDGPRLADAAGDALAAPDSADSGPPDDTLPAPSSDELTTRTKHLLEAIAKDDPDLATDMVFPRDAYITVKDAADPGKQWDNKVMGAFKSKVHALHKQVKGSDRAQFTAFEIGQPVSQTVPKKHDMLRSLWRVKKSRVVFTVEGKATHVEIAEMLSWRGAWYVLRLRGSS